MKFQISFAGCLLAAGLVGQVGAQSSNDACSAGTRVTGVTAPDLRTLLSGKTVCFKPGGATDWTWQEYHTAPSGGALVDYKRGSTDPVDPSRQVGTWSAGNDNNAAVAYSYTGGNSYTFVVCALAGGQYSFQGTGGATTVTPASLKTGSGPCP